MKSIFKKLAGAAVAMALVFCTTGCSDGSSDGSSLYSSCTAGDFILKDGSVLSKDSTPASGTVAAVIVRSAGGGKPALGVGINHTTGLAWCTSSAAGCSTNITALQCDTNITALQGDINSGYMDGRDGWEKLKATCSDAEEHPEYYPAWNYCRNYGSANGLTGDLANGWYLPTVAELYTIYQNKTAVDASLSKAGGTQFGTSIYWSCCQYPSRNSSAWALFFNVVDDGGLTKYSGSGLSVCSVKAFY